MATTSPDNLRTPNPGDPYNLVADLATLANDTQVALNKKVSNLLTGTAAQRAAFLSTAVNGMLWQDTDGIKMIWRKDGAAWVPAVWRWSGTTSQMNAFTQAPNGFEWFNTTDNSDYVYLGAAWSLRAAEVEVALSDVITAASGRTITGRAFKTRGALRLMLNITGHVDNTKIGDLKTGNYPTTLWFVQANGGNGVGQIRLDTGGIVWGFAPSGTIQMSATIPTA